MGTSNKFEADYWLIKERSVEEKIVPCFGHLYTNLLCYSKNKLKSTNPNNMKTIKNVAVILMAWILLVGCAHKNLPTDSPRKNAIAIGKQWGPQEWRNFIKVLTDKELVELGMVYGSVRNNIPGVTANGKIVDVSLAIKNSGGSRDGLINNMQENAMKAFWRLDEKVGTMFSNPGYGVQWHEISKRGCFWAGVSGDEYKNPTSSFAAEEALLRKLLADKWDKLNRDQRDKAINESAALKKLNPSQKTAILLGSGSVFVSTLSEAALLSGFSFYTTMSSVICASAGALGMTLPFSAYMGASSTVGFLSGPVGWTVVALGAGGAAFLYFDDGDKEKTIKIIVATHLMKLRVIEESSE